MKKLILTCLICLVCSISYAQPIQRVEISPLNGGVSFNTITFADRSITGWVTANSTAMVGRKEVLILNTSSTDNLYVTGVSGSTAIGTIYPRESVTFGASSSLNIFVSSNTVLECQVWEIR